MQSIAVLNSGGDSPGMNAAVAAVARSAAFHDKNLVGIIRGYDGVIHENKRMLTDFFKNARAVIEQNPKADMRKKELAQLEKIEKAVKGAPGDIVPESRPLIEKYREQFQLEPTVEKFLSKYKSFGKHMEKLDLETILDINNEPGSYLRTARSPLFKKASIRLRGVINLVAAGIQGMVVVGGDGSFTGASKLCEMGIPCIGIPGTIDNDLAYTEMTLGYDSAVNHCKRAVLEVRSTSRAHDRPHVIEVMGRDCGDIALRTAMATGAEILIVGEVEWDVEDIIARMQAFIDGGNTRATVVISEGAYKSMKPYRLYEKLSEKYEKWNRENPDKKPKKIWHEQEMNAYMLAEVLRFFCIRKDGELSEARATVVGYTQRGELPSAYDAAFAYEAGSRAVDILVQEKRQNCVIGIQNGKVYDLSIADALAQQSSPEDKRKEHKYTALYNLVNKRK